MLDLKIENAHIYDGKGSQPFHGAIGVKGDSIVAVGDVPTEASKVVDAEKFSVMPGIIDTHTHFDAQATWDPSLSPSSSLGVTTVIMGNCGFTIAPCRPRDRDLNMRNLTHVEGMSLNALRAGIDWGFESFPEYLDLLERKGVGLNVACFVGHSSIRTYVLAEDASKREANQDEIKQMKKLVVEALESGACGFSTTRSIQHNGEAGIPMPSRLASEQELLSLAGCLKETRKGIQMMTKDGERTTIKSIERLAQAAEKPYLVAALLHSNIKPESTFQDLDNISKAHENGNRLYGAISVCPLTMEFTMHEPYVLEGLKSWRPLMNLDKKKFQITLRDSKIRSSIKSELAKPAFRVFSGEWDKVFVRIVKNKENLKFEGKSLAAICGNASHDCLDFMLDLALEEDLDTVFTATLLNSDRDAVGRMINHKHSILSLSDAGAHQTFFCDAGFGLHVLGHWVRDNKTIGLPHAVQKLTSEPADLFGIRDRGRIEVGKKADLLMFDPITVDRTENSRIHDLPAGASRLTSEGKGIHGVWVNGSRIMNKEGPIDDGRSSGEVIRNFNT